MLLSIDPGESYGACLWDKGVLIAAYHNCLPSCEIQTCVIESQEISRRTRNPANIIVLAHTAGALAERSRAKEIRWVLAVTWKGTAPDHAIEGRILGALTKAERQVLDRTLKGVPVSHRHDVTDSAGIGLFFLKRLPI